MLETVRQFATELLVETGDHVRFRDRHARFFAGLAEEAEPMLVSEEAPTWMTRIREELPNIRSALQWGLRPQGDTDLAVRLVLALARYWNVRGTPTEGLRWLETLTSRYGESLDELTSAWLTYDAGMLAARQGDLERAGSCAAASLPVFRAHDDKIGIAWALNDLGLAALKADDYALAIERFEESIAVKRELGHDWDVARTLCNVGQLAWRCGDFDRAEAAYHESLAVAAQAHGDVPHELLAANKNNLAELDRCRGNYAAAEPLYLEALAAWKAVGNRLELALAMSGLGGTAAGLDHPRRAARLLGAADAERDALGVALDEINQAEHERMCAHARSLLSPEDWESAYEQGQLMSLDEAVAYALEGCGETTP
jgi:non-specific serine/threonine protein kinase